MLVGNIRTNSHTDSYSRTVEVLETEGVCEIVIRPGKQGANVLDAELTAYTGTRAKEWTKSLDIYLVREADGTVVYRIPVPLGTDPSKGEALPSTRVDSKFDFTVKVDNLTGTIIDNDSSSGEDGYAVERVETTYVPTGPFDGEYVFPAKLARYTIRYNAGLLYIIALSDLGAPHVAYTGNGNDLYDEDICQMVWTDEEFENYYQRQKNLYDDNLWGMIDYPIEGVKEIQLEHGVVKYFTIIYSDAIVTNGTVYCFYYALENGANIQGWWGLESNKGKPLDTFEKFILELFSNMEIEM